MKLPAQDRTKLGLAALLLAGAVLLAVHSFTTGGPAIAASRATPAAPAPPTSIPAHNPARPARSAASPAASGLDPRLHLGLLRASESIEYAGNGRNIFLAEADPVIPKPVAPAILPGAKAAGAAAAPKPAGPPPPPPIPLKFFGFASDPGQPVKAFFSEGDDVFVAAEGQIVDRRYRIIKINPNSVEIEDMLSNNRQTIPLTQS
jgi:hypothetical protein